MCGNAREEALYVDRHDNGLPEMLPDIVQK
jgi:hypothetical protein